MLSSGARWLPLACYTGSEQLHGFFYGCGTLPPEVSGHLKQPRGLSRWESRGIQVELEEKLCLLSLHWSLFQ